MDIFGGTKKNQPVAKQPPSSRPWIQLTSEDVFEKKNLWRIQQFFFGLPGCSMILILLGTFWFVFLTIGGETSNIFLCSPRKLWKMHPFWRAYFSKGLVQPPTSYVLNLVKDEKFPGWGTSAGGPSGVAPPGVSPRAVEESLTVLVTVTSPEKMGSPRSLLFSWI